MLFWRVAPTDNWELLTGPTAAPALSCYTDMLPDTSNLELKLITSDGIDAVEHTVSGITVLPRLPLLQITAPAPGTPGETNALWQLAANVINFPPHTITDYHWNSSLQGDLGNGKEIEALLSEGHHTLTFTVNTTVGNSVQTTVAVTVLPQLANTDLALETTDLQLTHSLNDPNGLGFNHLMLNETNRFIVAVRNQGATTSTRLRLFLTPPGSSEKLLGSIPLELEPFVTQYLAFDTLITTKGHYKVRALLDQTTPSETNTANNGYEWSFGTSVAVDLDATHHIMRLRGSGTYSYGSQVIVSVEEYPGATDLFEGWHNGSKIVSTSPTYAFNATEPLTLTATFVSRLRLYADTYPYGSGKVEGTGYFLPGETVTLTATANPGYQFVRWFLPRYSKTLSTDPTYSFTFERVSRPLCPICRCRHPD